MIEGEKNSRMILLLFEFFIFFIFIASFLFFFLLPPMVFISVVSFLYFPLPYSAAWKAGFDLNILYFLGDDKKKVMYTYDEFFFYSSALNENLCLGIFTEPNFTCTKSRRCLQQVEAQMLYKWAEILAAVIYKSEILVVLVY
jgi:hypothetical protein